MMNHNLLTCLLVLQVTTRARHIALNKEAIQFEGYWNILPEDLLPPRLRPPNAYMSPTSRRSRHVGDM